MNETQKTKAGWTLVGIGAVAGYIAGSVALIHGVAPIPLTVMVTSTAALFAGLGLADAL